MNIEEQETSSHLVAGVQDVGAVSPLGEDDVVLLFPLQAAALRSFPDVHHVVVLQEKVTNVSFFVSLVESYILTEGRR